MSKRILAIAIATLVFAFVHLAQAQQAAKLPRIGLLTPGGPQIRLPFEQGLRKLGYVEGQNISIQHRYANGQLDRLPELAAELVRQPVNLIVTFSFPAAIAAKRATTTIPIVVINAGDPVATGLVASLARPGGNIAGVSAHETELSAKRRICNGRCNLRVSYSDCEVVDKSWNKAPIADHNHLRPAALPVDPHVSGLCGVHNAEGGSRINEDPDLMVPDRDRDDRHQVAFMKGVWELDRRHTISSSRGTLSTEGIFRGSASRAFVSTSRRDSPTATSFSFTTATYLPAYFVTNSLKCSTIQRSSLSIISSLWAHVLTFFTIGCLLFLSQGSCFWTVVAT